MNVLAIGDVIGKPGRRALRELLPDYVTQEGIDFVVVNAENAAGGSGITKETADELFALPIDVLTSGDHIWKKREIRSLIESEPRLLRPANFSPEALGRGHAVFEARNGVKVGVINLQGRTFMKPMDCPFRAARAIVQEMAMETNVILVDMHAEATSEKVAMGRYLDGQASLVFGTHTHVQTADECILPNGTAYITDVGMTGPFDSIIGRRVEAVLEALVTQMPQRFDVAKGDIRLSGVRATIDPESGRATDIQRVLLCLPDPE